MAPTPSISSPRWPVWTVPVALVGALALAAGGQALLIGALDLAGLHVDPASPRPAVAVALNAVLDVALVVSAWLLAGASGARPTLGELGLRRVPLRGAIGPALAVAVGYIALAAIYGLLVRAPREHVPGIGAGSPTASVLAYALLVGVIAPVAEELFFRGFAFTALRRPLGTLGAALASGALFAVVHLLGSTDAVFVPVLALFGTGLALLYARTGSLLPGMALHSLNNAYALTLLVGWKWQVVPVSLGCWLVLAVVLRPVTGAAGWRPATPRTGSGPV